MFRSQIPPIFRTNDKKSMMQSLADAANQLAKVPWSHDEFPLHPLDGRPGIVYHRCVGKVLTATTDRDLAILEALSCFINNGIFKIIGPNPIEKDIAFFCPWEKSKVPFFPYRAVFSPELKAIYFLYVDHFPGKKMVDRIQENCHTDILQDLLICGLNALLIENTITLNWDTYPKVQSSFEIWTLQDYKQNMTRFLELFAKEHNFNIVVKEQGFNRSDFITSHLNGSLKISRLKKLEEQHVFQHNPQSHLKDETCFIGFKSKLKCYFELIEMECRHLAKELDARENYVVGLNRARLFQHAPAVVKKEGINQPSPTEIDALIADYLAPDLKIDAAPSIKQKK